MTGGINNHIKHLKDKETVDTTAGIISHKNSKKDEASKEMTGGRNSHTKHLKDKEARDTTGALKKVTVPLTAAGVTKA